MSLYQIRYRPDSQLGKRFPTTRYPWSKPGYEDRALAEQILDQCPNRDYMEIVEVPEP